MMGRQSRQMAMIFVDMESLIPENHLLRKIERTVSFDFIYDLLAPYYPATGRPSVDPVSMFKMLLIAVRCYCAFFSNMSTSCACKTSPGKSEIFSLIHLPHLRLLVPCGYWTSAFSGALSPIAA